MFSERHPEPVQNYRDRKDFMQNGKEHKLAWWLQVITNRPYCIYYFGPFDTWKEAELAQNGYIEDLNQEGAEGIYAQIRLDNPSELTIYSA